MYTPRGAPPGPPSGGVPGGVPGGVSISEGNRRFPPGVMDPLRGPPWDPPGGGTEGSLDSPRSGSCPGTGSRSAQAMGDWGLTPLAGGASIRRSAVMTLRCCGSASYLPGPGPLPRVRTSSPWVLRTLPSAGAREMSGGPLSHVALLVPFGGPLAPPPNGSLVLYRGLTMPLWQGGGAPSQNRLCRPAMSGRAPPRGDSGQQSPRAPAGPSSGLGANKPPGRG